MVLHVFLFLNGINLNIRPDLARNIMKQTYKEISGFAETVMTWFKINIILYYHVKIFRTVFKEKGMFRLNKTKQNELPVSHDTTCQYHVLERNMPETAIALYLISVKKKCK